jgi:RNA repair, ligase-Pnkp-associating, region of Hen1
MLLTITNTKSPATDLGYLLHKNPSRVQTFELSFGKVHVYYRQCGEVDSIEYSLVSLRRYAG